MTDQTWAIGQSKWHLDTPALMVDLPTYERNLRRIAGALREAGVGWRPHTKGQKVPALAHKALALGALGVTCAKLGEAEVMAAAGIRDILVANQVVGDQKIARLVNLLPHADVIVAVESESNIDALDRAAREKGVRLRVVIEVNIGMNRAGVEPGEPTVAFAREVARRPGLRLSGLMAWEGHTVKIADPAQKRLAVEQAVGLLTRTAALCRKEGLPIDIVSCGGTGTYAITAGLPGVTEVQAGGGAFCDVYYREHMHVDHEYALTVLATVTSRPSPTRIICDAGKKAMSCDAAVPMPRIEGRVEAVSLSAEHGRIDLMEPNTTLRVGDKLEFVVGYSDTTVCLHDELCGTRDGRVEVIWPILGRGKLR